MMNFINKVSQFTLNDLTNVAGIVFIILCYGISITNFSVNEIVYLLTILTIVSLGLNAILYPHKVAQTTSLIQKSF